MLIQSFQASSWYKALTLIERIASLPRDRGGPGQGDFDAKLASLRLERWQVQPVFKNEGFWEQRLALDSLSSDDFYYLLGESADALQKRFPVPPQWLAELDRAFTQTTGDSAFEEWLSQEESWQNSFIAHTVAITEPLLQLGKKRFDDGMCALSQAYPHLPFDPQYLQKSLFSGLIQNFQGMLNRTLVLELNVARLRGQLEGDTPEERFRSFLKRLGDKAVGLAILEEYPVLARQLLLAVEFWSDVTLEFFQRLCADWEQICKTFSPGQDPGRLEQLTGNTGDKHRGGHSVMILQFSSGLRLVYKPRSLAVDVHFQELLQWLNARGEHPPFRTLTILDQGDYGWIEFVEASACQTPEEIGRFYERQGGYLALLYGLEATDFHFENLIAAGEHPILIDLESLFHPYIQDSQEGPLSLQTVGHSVLRVGLLPRRIWATKETDGVDMSGLGGKPGQLTPYPVASWDGTGTDEMRFVRKRIKMAGGLNRPTLDNNEVNVQDYTAALVKGFTAVYRTLLAYRDELLSDRGPLAAFAHDEVRVILRPTYVYGKIYFESFHPDVLRDSLDRDRIFDYLWTGVEKNADLARVIPAERCDLYNGDIPIFSTRPSAKTIWSSTGQCFNDYCRESGLAQVHARICKLNETDLERQTWFIQASMATLTMGLRQMPQVSLSASEPLHMPGSQQWLEAACTVGDRLEMLAIKDKGEAAWIGLGLVDERIWSLVPLGVDLYGGMPGVAMFLAYLGDITGERQYTELAQATLNAIRSHVEKIREYQKSIGGFEGWGGIIYLLTHLGSLWQQPALLAEAEAIVAMLPDLIAGDEHLDIIGGAAGCIGALMCLYQQAPTTGTLAAAVQCGDHLLAKARPLEQSGGWLTPMAEKPLTGFSHGAAGIAWALMELAAVSGEDRFREAALAGLAYERTLFSPEAGNWLDVRDPEPQSANKQTDQPHFMLAWCHGAPGIGLSRIRMLTHYDDEQLRAEIDTAVRTTLSKGFGGNHSLCHGDLGNFDLLLQTSKLGNRAQWQDQKDRLSALIWAGIETRGWLCGVPQGVETPGLMNGLAGIGYGLLRLAAPERVPSILVMEAPIVPA